MQSFITCLGSHGQSEVEGDVELSQAILKKPTDSTNAVLTSSKFHLSSCVLWAVFSLPSSLCTPAHCP